MLRHGAGRGGSPSSTALPYNPFLRFDTVLNPATATRRAPARAPPSWSSCYVAALSHNVAFDITSHLRHCHHRAPARAPPRSSCKGTRACLRRGPLAARLAGARSPRTRCLLRVFVCMCVCTFLCMRACVHVCVHACMHVSLSAQPASIAATTKAVPHTCRLRAARSLLFCPCHCTPYMLPTKFHSPTSLHEHSQN